MKFCFYTRVRFLYKSKEHSYLSYANFTLNFLPESYNHTHHPLSGFFYRPFINVVCLVNNEVNIVDDTIDWFRLWEQPLNTDSVCTPLKHQSCVHP